MLCSVGMDALVANMLVTFSLIFVMFFIMTIAWSFLFHGKGILEDYLSNKPYSQY